MINVPEIAQLRKMNGIDLMDSGRCVIGAYNATRTMAGKIACVDADIMLIKNPEISGMFGGASIWRRFDMACRIESVDAIPGSSGIHLFSLQCGEVFSLDFQEVDSELPLLHRANMVASAEALKQGQLFIPVQGINELKCL